jgi:hypothetical protein
MTRVLRDLTPAEGLPMSAERQPAISDGISALVPFRDHLSAIGRLVGAVLRPWTLVSLALLVGHLVPLTWLTSGPSFCPFKVATGLPCPGCGLTRSSVALLHGDLGTSLYYHPLGVVMIVGAVIVGLVDLVVWWRGRRPGAEPLPPSWIMERIFATPAPWIAIAALAIVWVVRLPLYLLGTWTF